MSKKKKNNNTFKGFNNRGDNIENSNMPMSWGKEKENVAEKLFKEPMFFYHVLWKQFQIQETHKSPYRLNMNKIRLCT